MSEETKPSEGQATTTGEGQSVDVNEVMKRLEQLEGSYKRVLEESKSYKSKANEYKSKLEKIEEESVKSSGDLAKQLEYERKLREQKENENKSLKNKTLDSKIRETVLKYAKDVHDVDDLLNQPKHRAILLGGIDQENLTVDENAAKNYVNTVLNEKPWLKKHMEQPSVDTSKASPISTKGEVQLKKGEEIGAVAGALKNWV
jgi:archaellum component FlaC